jgi:hypothetical protein
VFGSSWRQRPLFAIALLAALVGTLVALRYARLDLTLSHYDARGHLVVARRILDSITPGWQQIGAVWLPLPHLLNALPVHIDLLYRTGASAVALSVLSFAVAAAAIAWIIASLTESWLAAAAGLLVFGLNPNVLYLQATPMTEPLLMALTLASIAALMAYGDSVVSGNERSSQTDGPSPTLVGSLLALACLTRYEAWPVTLGGLAVAAWAMWRRGVPMRAATRAVGRVALQPVAAIVGFSVFSKIVVGAWFASGFFVPENPAEGQPLTAVRQIVWGLHELSGTGVMLAAGLGLLLLASDALRRRPRASSLVPLALFGTAAVPWSAFVDGHPYRIRYMVPLIAAQAICAGVAAGHWRRARVPLCAALAVVALVELHPLNSAAPMVVEAQWDRPNATTRAVVTACLARDYHGESVMASMGSLGHYMQDLSKAGFDLRDFLHEGNGDIWLNALESPRPFVGWILIEEKAEGGDMLAHIARERPRFLEGYSRVCEGAGLALYRRTDASLTSEPARRTN